MQRLLAQKKLNLVRIMYIAVFLEKEELFDLHKMIDIDNRIAKMDEEIARGCAACRTAE